MDVHCTVYTVSITLSNEPVHVIFAIRVISTTICACRISWLVTRFYYLCLEPSVFRLLNKYFGFSGRAEKKKPFHLLGHGL